MDRFQQIYHLLTDEEDARACQEIGEQQCRQAPYSFIWLLLSQLVSKLADSFASARVVLPGLLAMVGVPTFFSSLLVPVRESGSLIPQLMIGGWLRRYPTRKPFVMLGSLIQGVAVVLIALVLYGCQQHWFSPVTTGGLVLLLVVFLSLGRGVCSVANKDVLGKTVPKSKRGQLGGSAASVAGLITLCSAGLFASGAIEGEAAFAVLLLLAAPLYALSGLFCLQVDEYAGATKGGRNGFALALGNLKLVREHTVFRRLLMARLLLMSSGLMLPYFVLLAQERAADGFVRQLGGFVVLSGLAGLLGGYVWGKMADKSSRLVLWGCALGTAMVGALAVAELWLAWQLTYLPLLLFFMLSLIHQGVRLGRKTYVVDLADEHNRTELVSVGNTLTGIMLLVVGALAAVVAQYSLTLIIGLLALSALISAWVSWRLPEV